jgi:hypothetical protein
MLYPTSILPGFSTGTHLLAIDAWQTNTSFDMRRQTSPQISLPEENTTTSPGTKSLWLIVIAVLQERLPGISPSL